MANSNNSQQQQCSSLPVCTDVIKSEPCRIGNEMPRLCSRHVLGFDGKILNGLVVHPEGKHIVYAVDRNIVIEDVLHASPGRQELLIGHREPISALAVSHDGRFIVSGERVPHTESRAPIIIWDWCSRQKLYEQTLHREATQQLTFTSCARYFLSLGCAVDGFISIWDTSDLKPIMSQRAQVSRVGPTNVVATSYVDMAVFVTVGDSYGRIWNFNRDLLKVTYQELFFGSAQRRVICAEVADKDIDDPIRVFCGTTTGSIMLFHGGTGVLITEILNPKFSLGVTVVTYVRMLDDQTYCFLVGSGEGKVGYYKIKVTLDGHKAMAKMTLFPGTSLWQDPQGGSCVTSISKLGVGQQFYVGLHQSHMQRFTLQPWGCKLVRTCSNSPVNDVAFARGTDELMITAEMEKVRVYNLKAMLEVRRYVRVGRECTSVCVRHDGTHIFTGWDEGNILVLGFEPEDLGLCELYRIEPAHRQAVTCMALTSVSDTLVTGGYDGFVSVWRLTEDLDQRGRLLRQAIRCFHMVDQKGPITRLRLSCDDQLCATTSLDGTATVYNMATGLCQVAFNWTCGLTSLNFCQTDIQLATSSSDGRLQWWDIVSGENIRELPASSSGGVRSTDLEPCKREMMATSGDDRLVKIWGINTGEVVYVGEGHSDSIHLVKFGPCGTILLSASKDGSVCIWDVPKCL